MYQNQVLPKNSLQRDSFQAYHPPAAPNVDGFKDQGRKQVPAALHLSDTAVVSSNYL